VTRSGPLSWSTSVAYATADGSARAGLDYTAASGQLTFAPGESSATFELSPIADTITESDETVRLSLRAPSGGLQLGSRSTATLTIHDDPISSPVMALSGLPKGIGLRHLLRHGVTVIVTPGAPVHALVVSLVGRARRAQISRNGALVLAERRFAGTSDTARTVTLKPRRRLVGRPSRAFQLRIVVTGTDAVGRRVQTVRTLRVALPRRR